MISQGRGVLLVVFFAIGGFVAQTAFGQTSPSAPPKVSTTAAQPEPGSQSLGFSMESEMLTYSAMEHNSEAVACDVATYIYGEDDETHRVSFTPENGKEKPSLTDPTSLHKLCNYASWYAKSQEKPSNSIQDDGVVIL